jgi:hypothetical protein
MGFLDNSGDIILDAVLTDTGRYRLAQGNGSFKITKFALGDDEINYGTYDKNHPSGSAYYDLEILQTPVLEAFTNNTSTMKSKLISIPRTNLLYLPVVRPNTNFSVTAQSGTSGLYVVGVNEDTVGKKDTAGVLVKSNGETDANVTGILNGFQPQSGVGDAFIQVAQGLDTSEIPRSVALDADLLETQYIVEMDNRFGSIVSSAPGSQVSAVPSFVDDDNIASYYLSLATDTQFVNNPPSDNAATNNLKGPGGTILTFRIQSSIELQNSSYLFEQLGSTGTQPLAGGGDPMPIRFIDSIIKITGATTGASTDLSVRFIRKQ